MHVPSNTTLEIIADRISAGDTQRFRAQHGATAGQSLWEILCLLIALRIWAKRLQDRHVRLRIRSDIAATCHLTIRFASPSPVKNSFGAGISLILESFSFKNSLQDLYRFERPNKHSLSHLGTWWHWCHPCILQRHRSSPSPSARQFFLQGMGLLH